MPRVRVVLAEMPLLLREIIRSILSTQADVELAADCVPADAIRSAEALAHADVLILAEPHLAEEDYVQALYAHPRLRLVAISERRRKAVLFELRPHRMPLGELSRASLVRAVHDRAADGGQP